MSKVTFSSSQSKQITMAIPVFIYGCKEGGDPFQELTRTLVVDVGGGLIELESPVVNGLRVLTVNENTDEEVECCVVCTQEGLDGKVEVGITFDKPSPNFWGIKFLSEDGSLGQSKHADSRQFIDGGTVPVTAAMYRKLMGRTH
jgi:hypothetical protein